MGAQGHVRARPTLQQPDLQPAGTLHSWHGQGMGTQRDALRMPTWPLSTMPSYQKRFTLEHRSTPHQLSGENLTILKRSSCSGVNGRYPVQRCEEAPALAGARRVCHASSQAGKGLGQPAAAPQRLRLQVPPIDAGHKLFQSIKCIHMTATGNERLHGAGELGRSPGDHKPRHNLLSSPPLERTWQPPSLGMLPA